MEGVLAKEKHILEVEWPLCRYGAVAFEGWRSSMEDEMVVICDWACLPGHGAAGFVGVYDGHFGSHVAGFCKKYLHRELLLLAKSKPGVALEELLKEAFLRMDVLMRTEKGQQEMARPELLNDENRIVEWNGEDEKAVVPPSDLPIGGACGIVGLIFKDKVVVANAGDCRCVLSSGERVVELSKDHKPTLASESDRIYAGGGFVNKQGRVSGVFNVSRGFGDFVFKDNPELPPEKQLMVAVPDVFQVQIRKEENEFLIFASDGIWPLAERQCESSRQVVNSVHSAMRMYPGIRLSDVCFEYMESFLAARRDSLAGTDNMTMVLVQFK